MPSNPLSVIPELNLKHRDGEICQLAPSAEDPRQSTILSRYEMEVTWDSEVYTTIGEAIGFIADYQAFGFRRGREPADMRDNEQIGQSELVEIEGLDLGGLLVDSRRHLPVVLHRRDLSLWRLRWSDEEKPTEPGTEIYDGMYVIETRRSDDPTASWSQVDTVSPKRTVGTAAQKLGEHAGVEVLDDCSSEAIVEALESNLFWFNEVDVDEREEYFRKRLGIQNDTVLFEDEVPEELDFGGCTTSEDGFHACLLFRRSWSESRIGS